MHNDVGLIVPLSSKLSVTCMALRLVLQMQDHSRLNKQFGSSSQSQVVRVFVEIASPSLICMQISWGDLKCRI